MIKFNYVIVLADIIFVKISWVFYLIFSKFFQEINSLIKDVFFEET